MKTHSTKFKRYCKTLQLKDDPELIKAYKKIHQPENTWPEISQGLKEIGVLDMEIYIYENRLFMIMDTVPDFNHDKAMEELAQKPRQTEWEMLVSKYQQTEEGTGSSADAKWQRTERIYKLP